MNKKNNIDQLFSSKLKDKTEVAPMHLWPDIQEAISPEPKKEKRFLWFGLFGFLLLVSSSLIVYAIYAQASTSLTTQKVPKEPLPQKTRSIQAATHQQNQLAPTEIAQTNSNQKVEKSTIQTTLQKHAKKSLSGPSKINASFLIQNTRKHSFVVPNLSNQLTTSSSIEFVSKSKRESHITPLLHQQEVPLLSQIEVKLPKNNIVSTPPEKECAGSRVIKVPKSIFVDAYVSPVFSNTFFAAKTPEAVNYAKLRDSTEGDKVGVLLGARVGYIHESGISLRAGVAYQQIRTNFKYDVEQDEKMIIQIFRDDNGNIIGRDTTFEFGRRHISLTNKYSTIDIPVSIGYISMKNKVQIGLHVGAILNLNFRQSGTYLNQETLVTKFSDKKIFARSMGTSFFGAVELQYLLADQWGIFVEPQVRFYPKSLTSKGHPIKQNVATFNMLTGIKYIF